MFGVHQTFHLKKGGILGKAVFKGRNSQVSGVSIFHQMMQQQFVGAVVKIETLGTPEGKLGEVGNLGTTVFKCPSCLKDLL